MTFCYTSRSLPYLVIIREGGVPVLPCMLATVLLSWPSLPLYSPGPETWEWCAHNELGLPISANSLKVPPRTCHRQT